MLPKNINLKQNPFYLSDSDIAWVDATLQSMTEDEKIQQLFFPAVWGFNQAYLDEILETVNPSGFMYRPCSAEQAVWVSMLWAKLFTKKQASVQ